MVSDLIFSVLPREGQAAIVKDEFKVEQVSKEARIRELNDEEKALNAEERDAREKHEYKQHTKNKQPQQDVEPEDDKDEDGHLDLYV
ncbi:hypothetical protein [Neptunicella sp. SCSIO 80796]|uniref:hypothetical protein n=1 Tax=Neptunicella plasticusilytica TaxID=3117012 RepID=UPI003A4DCFFE